MRLMLEIFLCLIPLSLAHSQAGDDPEQVVTRMIETGFFEGHDQKVVGRLGDAGAVFVTKIIAGKDLTPATIGNTLITWGQTERSPVFSTNERTNSEQDRE